MKKPAIFLGLTFLLSWPVAFLVFGGGMKTFERLEIGMTKDQVSEILGSAWQKDKSEMDAPGLGEMETWTYGRPGVRYDEYDERMIVITFLNGKVSKCWCD